MIEGVKPLSEKPNTIQEFTVQFFADSVSIDGTILPLGQVSADVLNLDEQTLRSLRELLNPFVSVVETRLWGPETEKDAALAAEVQGKMNGVLDVIFEMPLYRHLELDKEFAKNLLPLMCEQQPEGFRLLCNPQSMDAAVFSGFINKFIAVYDEALSFRTYIALMLDMCFERLKKRNGEHYAYGVYSFFKDAGMLTEVTALTGLPNFLLFQGQKTFIEYTTMPNPANEKEYIIAERMVFDSLGAFLHVDFFRGLMRGNAPRRCQNCGRFFLLTDGYDTRYCNNIAPGETKRTCRKVGAHRKEAQKAGGSLIQAEYKKVYNRLKTRRRRGKIDLREWNRQVALAQEYKDQAEKGQLSEFDLKRLYEQI